jgi:hypothetical protein
MYGKSFRAINLALPQTYPALDMVKNSYDLISGVLTVTYWIGADPTAFKLSHPCPLLQLTQACLKPFVISSVDIRQRAISLIEHLPQNKLGGHGSVVRGLGGTRLSGVNAA